jgi:demethylmenaquinone methyltransferase/2-methoxy-6-polyprenyl-1,4-benzoquinol methylase
MTAQNTSANPNIGKDPQKIQSMFARVAANYDRANNILSMGVHHLWRKKLVKVSQASYGDDVLDCATGTGDLAIEFKKKVGEDGKVIGTDFCQEMLAPAPEKAKALGLDIEFSVADVLSLPFENNRFDIVSIAFGIRNVADPVKAIQEMARVVRPGGRVMVLEFGKVELPVLSKVYNYYSEKILPKLGGWVTGEKEAYEYLQKSSAEFPSREQFTDLMSSTGQFVDCDCFPLTGGIAYLYRGIKKG